MSSFNDTGWPTRMSRGKLMRRVGGFELEIEKYRDKCYVWRVIYRPRWGEHALLESGYGQDRNEAIENADDTLTRLAQPVVEAYNLKPFGHTL